MIFRCSNIFFTVFINILFPLGCIAQHDNIPELFLEIDAVPQIILCKNDQEVNNQGGHLQGVQLLVKDNVEYAFISGSSSTYAYYSVARLDNFKEVLSINRLMNKPYKHAGGIQLFHGLLAVGIEDNETKDKSKVCIYEIENPEKPLGKPMIEIERRGEPYRSTSGCVSINKLGDKYLIIVGDWDTKHLDFYLCDVEKPEDESNTTYKVYTIDTEKIDRSRWSDKSWHAYQNINLLKDADGKLYLFGFGRNNQNQNITDLFLLEHKDLREFRMEKLLSKKFNCREGADFRSGAGIYSQPDGKLKVISCGSHIKDTLILNVFE